ncbi:MAG: histidine kinase [Roseivirga sp.]|nr:histidine kinase [Roseivirga sp.]
MHKRIEKLIHLSLWLMLLLLLFRSAGKQTRITENDLGEAIVSVSYDPWMLLILSIDILFKAVFFYGHVHYLIPRFKHEVTRGRYILWTCLLFIVTLITGLGASIPIGAGMESEYTHDLSVDYALPYSIIFHGFVLFLSLGYSSLRDKKENALLREKLKEEKLVAELKYLKSQVNPHFLFNTLNNIYSLVRKHEDPKAAESVARLGRLMRYMIYESNADTVALQKELDYLNDFIDLEKVRLHDQEKVSFQVDLNQSTGHQIAPMLLIPFVENAFKHGRESPRILIDITLEQNLLTLLVENTPSTLAQQATEKGIGLENVKKRLELLYPGRYALTVEEADMYSVKLELNLTDHV